MPIILALLAAPRVLPATAPPAPPTIVYTSPPAPPPFPAYLDRAEERAGEAPVSLEVRVSAGGAPIWEGPIRVGRTGAGISTSRYEAQPAACPGRTSYGDVSVRTGFTLTVSRGYRDTSDLFAVSATWSRATASGCALDGTRTAQVQSNVAIPDQGRAVLRGDGGLTVELRRR